MNIHSSICKGLLYFFSCFPIKNNKIVFCSYYGKYYNDNPKYIFEALTKKNNNLDCVWLMLDNNKYNIPRGRVVKKGSIQSLYELATAEIWVDNCRKPLWMRKRKQQYYIQTWHAGIGLKAGEKACVDKFSQDYIQSAINDSKMADLFLANSDWLKNLYKKYFWYDGLILKSGLPREDSLSNNSKKVHNKICQVYNVPLDTKFLLYAPTFRDSGDLKAYDIDYYKVIQELERKSDRNWKIIVRLHPNIKNQEKLISYNNKILNGTIYPEINDLILASEYLITDYSSCMFDGMIAKKNVLIYANDIEEYGKERGYLFELEDLPFCIATNNKELLNNIKVFDQKDYQNKIATFMKSLGLVTGGNASEVVAEHIMNIIKERR